MKMVIDFYGKDIIYNGKEFLDLNNEIVKTRITEYEAVAMYKLNLSSYQEFCRQPYQAGILYNNEIVLITKLQLNTLLKLEKNEIVLPIDGEEWKFFPENKVFLFSNLGRVKTITNRKANLTKDKDGYFYFLNAGNRVNRVVYDLFVGIKDKNNVIKHLDNDKQNNALYNLMEDSQKNNVRDSIIDGRRHQSKREELTKIVALFNDRLLPTQIKKKYPEITFSLEALAKTRAKKVYSHITEELGLKDFAERSYLLQSEYDDLLNLINEGKTNKEIFNHFNYIPIKLTTIKDLKKRLNKERISQ